MTETALGAVENCRTDVGEAAAEELLTVDGIVKNFGGLRAVDHASFHVRRGSLTALIGPNGAGKTSLFNVVSGFMRADDGDVRYDGRSIAGRAPHSIARAGLVRTFQLTRTLAFMTVLENMMVAAPGQPGERLRNLVARPRYVRRRESEVREQARELLGLFGLSALEHEAAGVLSGGQRKLLDLGRALMLEPQMVLLDEPMAGVNRTLGRELLHTSSRSELCTGRRSCSSSTTWTSSWSEPTTSS